MTLPDPASDASPRRASIHAIQSKNAVRSKNAAPPPPAPLPAPAPRPKKAFRFGSINQWYEAFVLLNFIDIVLTLFFVQRGGYETNPVGAFIAEHYGWASLASFKFAQCILVILISAYLYSRRRKIARLIMGLACAVYFTLMMWDAFLLIRMPRIP